MKINNKNISTEIKKPKEKRTNMHLTRRERKVGRRKKKRLSVTNHWTTINTLPTRRKSI
jgi:hypothetical protein